MLYSSLFFIPNLPAKNPTTVFLSSHDIQITVFASVCSVVWKMDITCIKMAYWWRNPEWVNAKQHTLYIRQYSTVVLTGLSVMILSRRHYWQCQSCSWRCQEPQFCCCNMDEKYCQPNLEKYTPCLPWATTWWSVTACICINLICSGSSLDREAGEGTIWMQHTYTLNHSLCHYIDIICLCFCWW